MMMLALDLAFRTPIVISLTVLACLALWGIKIMIKEFGLNDDDGSDSPI